MNKIFTILLLIVTLVSLNACVFAGGGDVKEFKGKDKIKWMTFEQAVAANEKNPKKLFIDVYTDWCGWCKRMDAATFQDDKISGYINETYYPVRFNAERKDSFLFHNKYYKFIPEYKSHELAVQMLRGNMAYPTVVIFNENLTVAEPIPGYQTPDQLMPILQFFGTDAYKTQKFEDFQKQPTK